MPYVEKMEGSRYLLDRMRREAIAVEISLDWRRWGRTCSDGPDRASRRLHPVCISLEKRGSESHRICIFYRELWIATGRKTLLRSMAAGQRMNRLAESWGFRARLAPHAPASRACRPSRPLRWEKAHAFSSATRMGPFSASLRCRSGTSLRRACARLARSAGKCSAHFLSSAPCGFDSLLSAAKSPLPMGKRARRVKGAGRGKSACGSAARARCAARARG